MNKTKEMKIFLEFKIMLPESHKQKKHIKI